MLVRKVCVFWLAPFSVIHAPPLYYASQAMPLLLWVAGLGFGLKFWVDKWALLRVASRAALCARVREGLGGALPSPQSGRCCMRATRPDQRGG